MALTSVRANIPFLAKVVEKIVVVQIHSYLEDNLLMPSCNPPIVTITPLRLPFCE